MRSASSDKNATRKLMNATAGRRTTASRGTVNPDRERLDPPFLEKAHRARVQIPRRSAAGQFSRRSRRATTSRAQAAVLLRANLRLLHEGLRHRDTDAHLLRTASHSLYAATALSCYDQRVPMEETKGLSTLRPAQIGRAHV